MSKVVKGFIAGVALLGAIAIPACRPKPKPPVVVPEVQPAITIPPPPVPTTTTVETKVENRDFVKTDTEPAPVTSTVLPTNVEDLNRMAQERGFFQDAFFDYNESALSNDAQAALNSSASWLKQHAEYNILVEGHCDERGTEQYNLALGDKRAQQAKDYLVASGVDASRIRTVSYGEERPFDPGHDESAWSQNRRAHLVLVGK